MREVSLRTASRPKVLLLSRHEDTLELYRFALDAAGFEVHATWFTKPPPASFVPDLVVACMPQPDAALIRSILPPGCGARAVVLAGWIPKGTTAATVGCDALLLLPVTPNILVDAALGLLQAA